MKKLAISIIALFCAATFATGQAKDTLAVRVISPVLVGEAQGAPTVIRGELEKALSRSKTFVVVSRTAKILNAIDKEHVYAQSGAVNDAQIKKIGNQLGVQYLCIVEINPTFRFFHVDAQLVNVESAEILKKSTAGSRLESYNEQLAVAKKIAFELTGVDAPPERQASRETSDETLMKPKYENTKMYPSEYLGAYGTSTAIGPNDILTVLYAEHNYYKVRTAAGKEGFVLQKDVINSDTPFVDTKQEQETQTLTDTRQETAAVKQEAAVPARQEYVVYDFTVGQRFGTWGVNYVIAGLGSLTIMRDYTGAAIHAGSAVGGFGLMVAGVSNNSPELAVIGVLSVAGGSVFSIVRSITYHKPGSQPRPSDFTTGERWGTWGLNSVVPGLGSAIIMKDYVGAGVMAGASIVGTTLIVSGYVNVFNDVANATDPNDVRIKGSDMGLILVGMGFTTFSSIWNIFRSAGYNHTDYRNAAVNPLGNLNIAVLPDQDGNIKGHVAYSMEF